MQFILCWEIQILQIILLPLKLLSKSLYVNLKHISPILYSVSHSLSLSDLFHLSYQTQCQCEYNVLKINHDIHVWATDKEVYRTTGMTYLSIHSTYYLRFFFSIMEYCKEHENTDHFVNPDYPKDKKDNPWIEQKKCNIL